MPQTINFVSVGQGRIPIYGCNTGPMNVMTYMRVLRYDMPPLTLLPFEKKKPFHSAPSADPLAASMF